MNKRLLFAALILILVSISWFQPVFAQNVASAEDIEKLRQNPQLYQQYLQRAQKQSTKKYTSQPIFSKTTVQSGLKSATADQGFNYPTASQAESERRLSAAQSATASEWKNRVLDRTDTLGFSFEDSLVDESSRLRPFGLEFFERSQGLVEPVEIANAADYTLGPGDNLIVYLWGRVEKEFNLTIDRQGKIFIPPLGEIVAWGRTLDEFEETLRRSMAGVYSDFKMNVTLGKIRSIRVYVIGEVKRPGSYTVSSLTTLFNALYLAGGPTERGSLREIKLLRGKDVAQVVDLYDFLIAGDNSADAKLQSGDAIFVPVVQRQAYVMGEVKRPAIYELTGKETAFDALNLAGGATATGYLAGVSLERVSGQDEPRLYDLNLEANSDQADVGFTMLDGDRMTVNSLYDVRRNYVAIGGMVKHPGRYERSEGLKFSEALSKAQLSPMDVYYKRAYVFRTYPDNRREALEISLDQLVNGDDNGAGDLLLFDRDSIHIYSMQEVQRKKYVYIDGEIRRPGEYPLYDGMHVADLIFLAGELKRAAHLSRAEIAHTDSSGEVTLSYVDLKSGLAEITELSEDDRVYIRQIPEWSLNRRVIVEGEVMFPGEYSLTSRDETLWSVLTRVGGFTSVAFPQGLALERSSISLSMFQKNLARIISSNVELEEDSLGRIREVGQVRYDPRSLDRIIIDMDRLIASSGREGDIILQDGDRVFVPQIPPGISVLGAVGASGTIKFESEKKAKYYIDRAGGMTRQADKGEVKLVKADGRVFSGGSVGKNHVQLGDAIIVPSKVKKDSDWMRSASSLVSVITGLATSVFIITKL